MPSQADLDQFARRQASSSLDVETLVPKLPPVPEDVKRRFPTMAKWEEDLVNWRAKLIIALRGGPV